MNYHTAVRSPPVAGIRIIGLKRSGTKIDKRALRNRAINKRYCKTGILVRGLFSFGQPGLNRLRRCFGFWRSHSNRERGRYYSRASNNAAQFFFSNANRLPYQLGDTVSPKAGVVIGRVFLRQQEGLIHLALPVNIANVGSCKYPALPFTAEGYPLAVT